MVRLEPWGAGDRPLLERLLADPVMTEHLGGPESPEKIAERQGRYEQPGSNQFKIVSGGEGVGWVGFWELEWGGETVYELGWSVVPEFQGRGIAAQATVQALEAVRAEGRCRFAHACPSVDNGPSNAICRKAGFELMGQVETEYPPGTPLTVNDWRLDLRPEEEGPPRAP